MVSDLFDSLDSFARVIGWIAIIVFALFMLWVGLKVYFTQKDEERELDARGKFEKYLYENKRKKWERYMEIRGKYHVRREYPDWRVVASDAGVTEAEILENRSP